VSAAEKRALARENDAKKKAGQKYLAQAGNLEAQAKAIKEALKTQFGSARDQNLADISMQLNRQIAELKSGHQLRAQQFLGAAKDTEAATAGAAEQGISNLVRERADSLSAILEQGAGETDAMRAMVLSARNWHANQSEVNRSYFDSMRSVNSGINDLNLDTRGQMVGATSSAEGERDRIWQDFYNRRSEAFTQLGNIRGQQRDYYAEAKEMGVSPKKGAESSAKTESEKAFMDAAKESGKSYVQQDIPTWLKQWQGQEQLTARQSNSNLAAAMTFEPIARAEGATLRKWAA
jgi:hypothetical protein